MVGYRKGPFRSPWRAARRQSAAMRESCASRCRSWISCRRRRFPGARSALIAPLAVVLVAPQRFLQNGINDVIRAALDELGVVVEKCAYGFLHANFARKDVWSFLYDWHDGLLRSEFQKQFFFAPRLSASASGISFPAGRCAATRRG